MAGARDIPMRLGAIGKWISAALVPLAGFHLSGGGPASLAYVVIAPFISAVPATLAGLCAAVLAAASWFYPGAALGRWLILAVVCVLLVFFVNGRLVVPGVSGSLRGRFERRFLPWIRPLLWITTLLLAVSISFRFVPPIRTALWACSSALVLAAANSAYPKSGTPWKRAFPGLMLGVGTLVFCLVALELGAWWFIKRPIGDSSIWEHDPRMYFRMKPDSRVSRRFGETGAIHVNEISAEGMRGPAGHRYGPKAAGEYRIGILGDSFAFGSRLNFEKSIPQVLERMLREELPSNRITVINMGIPGSSPWQQRIFLSEHAASLDLDACVLQIFPANDIYGSLEKRNGWLRSYSLSWKQYLYGFANWDRWQIRSEKWLTDHCSLYYWAKQYTDRPQLFTEFLDSLRILRPTELGNFPPNVDRPFWIESCLRSWYPELIEGFGELCKDVTAIRADCTRSGIDTVAFVVPEEGSVIPQIRDEQLRGTPYEGLYELAKDVRLTEAFLADAGFPFVDLLGPLSRHPEPRSLYYRHDGHFTPAGARFVAGLLRDAIIERYFPGPPK